LRLSDFQKFGVVLGTTVGYDATMAEDRRPDPDALLAAIQKGEAEKKRGKFKVFLGMAAGVGKTYAMLRAAQRAQSVMSKPTVARRRMLCWPVCPSFPDAR
jgi:hypothetical protein